MEQEGLDDRAEDLFQFVIFKPTNEFLEKLSDFRGIESVRIYDWA